MFQRFIVVAMLGLLTVSSARAADTYKIDPVHSMVVFRIGHLNLGLIYGRFNEPAGTIVIDEASPENSKFDLHIQTANIDTANQERDKHLRSPDFFDAEKYPVISFTTTSVKAGDEEGTWQVSGEFDLHGVKKPITVTVRKVGAGGDPWGNQRIGFAAEVDLKRSDFGITFMPEGVGDDVHLMIAFEGIKQ